ncbi:uncharacterized protein BXZ73DRAFT_87166 [Epithele typhae]|uniref:uncharacterized protein n=1 Tax=Epithele typhae TaxID=378194 RepID=UPI002007481D|nr:uncharacterized protein BXZ73DRAFT_87166 [Epithele typhae]KAH9944223.1 hypothetical protein BXZ73DRAFT_87166 [Epithele typhae]
MPTFVDAAHSLPLTPPLSATEGEFDKPLLFNDIKQHLEDALQSEPQSLRYERKMGTLSSRTFCPRARRAYLHIGINADARITHERFNTVWAIMRLRHPMLCARAEMRDYDDVRFVYNAPASPEQAWLEASANIELRSQTKEELIDSYLNGPRTLSNERLSYILLSEPAQPASDDLFPTPPRTPEPDSPIERSNAGLNGPPLEDSSSTQNEDAESEATPAPRRPLEFMLCVMHFLADGIAIHNLSNDIFCLVGGDLTDEQLHELLREEWTTRWAEAPEECVLPGTLEERVPKPTTPFRRVAAQVDYQLSQARLIGGQAFPRHKHPERLTIVPTIAYPEARTKEILKACKVHGVSISAALFAICNVAWARMGARAGSHPLPTLMYSALNLRPYFARKALQDEQRLWDSYFFDAQAATFWRRARSAKEQSTRAVKHPLAASRTHGMAEERGVRARMWGREDDEKERGTWAPPAPATISLDALAPREPVLPKREKASAAALLGLSLLGNLDGIYKHAAFPSTELYALNTGSRQRNGAMLMFGYTFKGKVWISLGYDCNGFEGDVVDRFWKECLDCVEEFMG